MFYGAKVNVSCELNIKHFNRVLQNVKFWNFKYLVHHITSRL
jgi:hypothetical protein